MVHLAVLQGVDTRAEMTLARAVLLIQEETGGKVVGGVITGRRDEAKEGGSGTMGLAGRVGAIKRDSGTGGTGVLMCMEMGYPFIVLGLNLETRVKPVKEFLGERQPLE
jgi:hypothetical protein